MSYESFKEFNAEYVSRFLELIIDKESIHLFGCSQMVVRNFFHRV
ncbi:MAG: hypothetical protein ACTS73_03480 [Arsenophonus sp. NEOnobi-MAG3]